MIRPSEKQCLVLELLARDGELYPAEMVRRSAGELKAGSIYVLLGRMVERGLLKSRRTWASETAAHPRRLFQLTGLGSQVLAAEQAARLAFEGAPA